MSNAVYYIAYKLKKGASVSDFLLAAEALNNGHISKQKGYISWKQLRDGETWADACIFETMDDLQQFLAASRNPSELAEVFYSFINLNSCRTHFYEVTLTF